MKILTNKTISSFLSKLTLDSIPVHEKVEKIQFVVQFIDWLTDSKELSPGDAIRFRNELYKKKRELSYKQAPKLSLPLKYVGFSLGILSLLLVVGGIYIRFFRNTNTPFAYSTAPVQAGRTISFQGRLTDSLGNPINAPIDITYNFYTAPTGGTPITGSTRVCTAGPDQDGVFSSLIGNDSGPSCNTELPNSIFTENTTVYLGVTVGTEPSEMTPRQQIANVGYAINSETLQGMPPGQSVSNVPFINQDGNMLIGASNPGIRSTYASSNFTISSAQATTIQSAGSGDITLSASEGGSLRFKAYNGTLEEVMTILNTGRVGIGITAPRALLDVNGDATVSGSLIAGGQIKVGEFTSPPTNLGNGSLYYDSNTNKIYFWNGTAWADMGSGTTQYFQRTLGSLAPTYITDDINLGAVATGSAIVHLPGTNNQNAWFNLGTGNVGIGTTAPLSKFSIGASGDPSYTAYISNGDDYGIFGSGNNYGVYGSGGSAGVYGFSSTNNGVLGSAAGTGTGLYGTNSGGGFGAYATSVSGTGGYFASTNGVALITGTGNVGIGNPSPTAKLDVSGNLKVSTYATVSGSLALGTSNAAAGPGNLSMSGNLLTDGSITFSSLATGIVRSTSGLLSSSAINLASADVTGLLSSTNGGTGADNSSAAQYSVPYYSSTGVLGGILTPGSVGYVLSTNGAGGAPSWINASGVGTNYWEIANGALYPVNATLDAFIGGAASASAKFAFLNVSSGTPTASISGTTANVNTFIDGNGNIGTTNRTSLVLGNSATYDSTGNILLNPNGTGNVGIGTTNPDYALDVAGNVGINEYIYHNDNNQRDYFRFLNDRAILVTGNSVIFDTQSENFNVKSGTLFVQNSSSNVGIGNITPAQKLDVVGNATVSGDLMAGGQLQIGRFGSEPTAVGVGSFYFNTTDNTPYYHNGTTWTAFSSGGANYWNISSGAIYPINSTLDMLIGGTASASAKFAFLNVGGGTPTASVAGSLANVATYLTGDGNLGTTNMAALTVGGASTGSIQLSPKGTTGLFVDGSGNVGVGTTAPANPLEIASTNNQLRLSYTSGSVYSTLYTDSSGYTHLSGTGGRTINDNGIFRSNYLWDNGTSLSIQTVGTGRNIIVSTSDVADDIQLQPSGGNVGIGIASPNYVLDVVGDINLTGAIRANGDAGTSGYILTSAGGGVNTWTDPSTLGSGANLWKITNGALYPVNATLDAFIGGTASASAKFAFLNVNSGTPTASVAGSLANVATYLTGNGNLATTNMAALTVGGASTGSIQLSPKGTTGLNINGNGDVGVGIVPDSTARLQIYKYNGTNNAATTGTLSNILLYQTASSDFNNNAFQYNLQTAANTGVTNNWSQIGFGGGVQIGASHLGTFGTVTGINNWNYILAGAAGTVSSMNGMWINQTSTGANTTSITNSRGIYISTPTLNGATLANNYGIYLEDQSSIGGTSNYSIYSAGGANYFAGNTGIGISPTYKLDVSGDINLTGALRANGSAGTTGYILTSAGGGVNTWTDPASLITGGETLWTILNGALYPVNATVDTFIGGTASSSAKFAFLNVNSGTPTASISGTTANVNTFIDGNGNIGTTNRKTLTIGNSTTYNTTGNVLINPNAASNVGIGTIDPQTLFHVQQVAVTSTAEEIARFNVSDDATAYFSLRNGSTTDGLFSPQMRFRGSGSTTAGNIQAMITTDTGTSPALVFTSQLASSALATRPVLAIRNYTTDLMTVLANGSVGIGTTSPLAALDIRKTSGTTPVASISGATSKSTLVVDQSGVGDIMTASSSGETRFVVKNNGNVGIGLTNPTYKLDVNGTVRGDIFTDTVGSGAYYVDPSGDSVFGGGLSLVGGFTASSASVSGNLTMGYGGQLRSAYGPLNLAYKSGLNTWSTGLILQDTTGNVGIGTIAPVANLHVFSAANAQMRLETGANADGAFNILEDGGANDHGASFALDGTNNVVSWQSVLSGVGTNVLSIPYAGTYANRIGINTTTPLASLDLRSMLGTIPVASISGNTSQAALIVDQSGIGDIFTASSSGETRFVIKSNGNVGIGVSDPTSKLSIAGTSSTISNLSGDIVFDSASNNISFSNDNLINVGNIASIGQIQVGGFASPPTSIGNGAMYYDTVNNKIFYWDGSVWSEMGSKYWQRTLGSLSPQYITDALNLGAIASGSALVHLPGTNNQDAWFNLGTGTVGIGTTTPDSGGYGYKLDVTGTMVADQYFDSASNSYYVDPAGDSVLGGNVTLGDIFMIDGTPLISSLNAGSYSTITIKGSGDTTTASLCVDEGTGSACDGKINAGTIDPPYTINGKKYATYLPSMTGVKEETTGKVMLTERNEEAKAYIKRIALGNQHEDSDLWLFAKATNLKDQIQDMTVLLSSNTNGKTWYSVDPATMVLTFYSSTPSEVSYRLTAPRFDAGRWANTRHESDFGTGFILNDRGNILAGDAPTYTAPKIVAQGTVFTLIGNFIEEFTAANQALFANITAGIISTQKIISPIAEIDTLNVSNKIQSKEINTELLKASNTIETPRLNTNVIDIGTQSGQLAKLVINGLYNTPVVTIDAEGSATFAGTLTAEAVQTENASISGTLIAKEIQSETIDALSTQLASNSSTLASSYQELSGDINAVQQELAALRTSPLPNASYYQNLDATYNSLSITDTANIYKAYISDSLVVGSLFMEDHSILALASDLSISSLGTITFFDGSVIMAKNGNITSKGEISASSLAIKNKEGVTVAEIDASGSARFNEVIAKKFSLESIATQGALIADSGIVNNINVPIPAIKTNAEVAGIGAVPQDAKEVIIYNDNVTEDSLIYLTPTSDNMQGQLSVSKKVTCAPNATLPCTPYFIVSSSLLIHTETPFNWLIIN
ncbi:MAG: hypothetical protein WA100_04280 [Microgenomates group bacterium]